MVSYLLISKRAFLKPGFLWEGRYWLYTKLIVSFGDMYNRAFWAQCRWQNCELEWLIRGPILLYDLHISQLTTVGQAETFESWPSEKGVNSKWKTKKKTCPWLIASRLSQRYIARFISCTLHFETRLGWPKGAVSRHIYMYYCTLLTIQGDTILTPGGKGY